MFFIDYNTLKDFYTIDETCSLLEIEKSVLKAKCEQLGIRPSRNATGKGCFSKHDFRRLHNTLFHEAYDAWDPWQ